MFSSASLLLLVVSVAVHLAQNGTHQSITSETLSRGRGDVSFFGFVNAASNVVFAVDQSPAVPQIAGELTPEPTVKRMWIAASICGPFLFLLYGSVSVLGLLSFGVEDQQDTFILDLEPMRRHPLVVVTFVSVAFSCVVQFPILLYPARQFLAYCVKEAWGCREQKRSDSCTPGRSFTWLLDVACSIVLVLGVALVAVLTTQIRLIISFVGALSSSWVSYILPGILFIQLQRSEKKFKLFGVDTLVCFALIAAGVFFASVGTYAAIVG